MSQERNSWLFCCQEQDEEKKSWAVSVRKITNSMLRRDGRSYTGNLFPKMSVKKSVIISMASFRF